MTASTNAIQSALFDRVGWWDERDRSFASLRAVAQSRLRQIRHWLPELTGLTVVDLGSGGGLLAVPLHEGGARVVAVDRAGAALREARRRSGTLACVHGHLDAVPLRDGCADIALLVDVLEHDPQPMRLLSEAARILRPGGWLFVNTINRTLRARLLVVALAEGLGLIPRGTHDPQLFLRPAEVAAMARSHGLQFHDECGERPALLSTLRRRAVCLRPSRSNAVSYACLFRKARSA